MKRHILLSVFVLFGLVAFAQSPLKTVSFHKNPNEIVDLRELKEKAGRDSDMDGNKAARIRIKAQGFEEKKLLDFTVFPRPGIEVIYKEFQQGEMWVYVSSKVQGTLVIKYMGEFEFKLPSKLEPKCGYDLVLGMETATLVIRATPESSDIYIDNEKVGTGYASKAVSIGTEHRWKVQCLDYFPKEGVKLFSGRGEESIDVELDPNFGYITVVSDPAGAELYVDGKKVGTTPYMFEHISRGQHRVEVKKERYNPYVNVVNVKIGETIQLNDVKLTAIRVPMGSMELTSNPTGAVITINGRQYGQTPKTLTDFEVGTYTVYFSKEGYQNLSQTVEVKDGKKETLAVTMTKTTVPQPQVPTTPVVSNTSVANNHSAFSSSSGVFSVSSNNKVRFAKGNLQYQASTKTWRFAEHQWDMIGDANTNISSSYSGWIDLFGWGTSGYNGKNPWMMGQSTDFGDGERDIAGTNYDWGVYNTISNGGGNSWRTLTEDEWVYVFDTRSTSSGIRYAKAIVNGVNGVILLPDNWSTSNYSLNNTNDSYAHFGSNRISQTDWKNKFEANGAVFLPAAGFRYGIGVCDVGSNGMYWSASYYNSSNAYTLDFKDYMFYYKAHVMSRFIGHSVRLVHDVEN